MKKKELKIIPFGVTTHNHLDLLTKKFYTLIRILSKIK
jgi:hypothetical protein